MKRKFSLLIKIITVCCIFPNCHQNKPQTQPFCTRLKPVKITGRRPAFSPIYKLQWAQNSIINVFLMDSVAPVQIKLLQVANQWSKYCNISFKPVEKLYQSQIRITFRKGGYASAVGIECNERAYHNVPTMFLEGLDTMKDTQQFNRIVLHEFGHALGLEHELKKPSAKIPWDSAAVYTYYKTKYNWEKSDVDKNIFASLIVEKRYEDFDSTSIMVYAVPSFLTKNHSYSVSWPRGLSSTDIKGIGEWYPK